MCLDSIAAIGRLWDADLHARCAMEDFAQRPANRVSARFVDSVGRVRVGAVWIERRVNADIKGRVWREWWRRLRCRRQRWGCRRHDAWRWRLIWPRRRLKVRIRPARRLDAAMAVAIPGEDRVGVIRLGYERDRDGAEVPQVAVAARHICTLPPVWRMKFVPFPKHDRAAKGKSRPDSGVDQLKGAIPQHHLAAGVLQLLVLFSVRAEQELAGRLIAQPKQHMRLARVIDIVGVLVDLLILERV